MDPVIVREAFCQVSIFEPCASLTNCCLHHAMMNDDLKALEKLMRQRTLDRAGRKAMEATRSDAGPFNTRTAVSVSRSGVSGPGASSAAPSGVGSSSAAVQGGGEAEVPDVEAMEQQGHGLPELSAHKVFTLDPQDVVDEYRKLWANIWERF